MEVSHQAHQVTQTFIVKSNCFAYSISIALKIEPGALLALSQICKTLLRKDLMQTNINTCLKPVDCPLPTSLRNDSELVS